MNKPIYLIEDVKGSVNSFKGKFIDKREKILIKSIRMNEVIEVLKKR